ncbi:TPA: glycohydrolase toxin TNT-related protein, partial [Neisseria subflava]
TDNRLKTYNGTTYYYDDLGNLIHRELADGEVQNYFYDLHDQLVKVEIFKKDGTKETWAYTYDALGRRIGKGRLKNEEVSDGLEEETRFVWDGSHLLQEIQPDGRYTYLYTDPDSYEPLVQVRNWTTEESESRQQTHYFHCDQIGIPREMTDKDGNLLWFGNYTGWGRLKEETKVTDSAYQPFRLQNQYCDRETGLHYNFFRYYEPDAGRFVNQDPIGLLGGDNLYQFAPNTNKWLDVLGLNKNLPAPYWPPNRGALGEVRSITLPVGTLVDRYGYPGGTFVSPVGTPYPMRALPPGSNQKPYTIYRVLKPIDNVAASKIMPWFGEIGLGTQYELPKSVKSYIESGHLEEVKIGKC